MVRTIGRPSMYGCIHPIKVTQSLNIQNLNSFNCIHNIQK